MYGGNFGGGGAGGMKRGGGQRRSSGDPDDEKYRKLFIGGLSFDTTEQSLRDHFGKWGDFTDVVVMKNPETKKSRGFGFVTYSKPEMVDLAQENRPHYIDSRKVETKRAMPREESGNPDAQASVTKLFIGGMKDGTTEEEIRQVFEEYGEIKSVKVVTDTKTGNAKGYCFVEFEDYDSVDRAVLKKIFCLNGKNVDVKKAKQKDGEGGGRGGGRGGRGGGRGGSRGGGNYGGQYGGSGGYNQGYGGYNDYSGGYDNYGGGYNQDYDQGGYGDSGYGGGYNQGSTGYNQFGQGYGGAPGGGPMRGSNYQSRGSSAPYQGGGYGRGGGRGGGYN